MNEHIDLLLGLRLGLCFGYRESMPLYLYIDGIMAGTKHTKDCLGVGGIVVEKFKMQVLLF